MLYYVSFINISTLHNGINLYRHIEYNCILFMFTIIFNFNYNCCITLFNDYNIIDNVVYCQLKKKKKNIQYLLY